MPIIGGLTLSNYANNVYSKLIMMNETKTTQLKKLLMGYLVIAQRDYPEDVFEQLQAGRLQHYITLVNEVVPIEHLVDRGLVNHALHDLASGRTDEETIVHAFALSVYKMMSPAKLHPLEIGIIKQQVAGVIPLFERGVQENLVGSVWFEQYAKPLLAIVEGDEAGMTRMLTTLAQDYQSRS